MIPRVEVHIRYVRKHLVVRKDLYQMPEEKILTLPIQMEIEESHQHFMLHHHQLLGIIIITIIIFKVVRTYELWNSIDVLVIHKVIVMAVAKI